MNWELCQNLQFPFLPFLQAFYIAIESFGMDTLSISTCNMIVDHGIQPTWAFLRRLSNRILNFIVFQVNNHGVQRLYDMGDSFNIALRFFL